MLESTGTLIAVTDIMTLSVCSGLLFVGVTYPSTMTVANLTRVCVSCHWYC